MTRTSIVGAAPRATRKRKDEPANDDTVGGDSVLVDQFAREFQALWKQVHDTRGGAQGGTTTGFSADGDVQSETRAIAHYGVIGQRLLALVRRLVDRTPELAVASKARVLLLFGDKMAALHEDHAADRYFYSEVAALLMGFLEQQQQQPGDETEARRSTGNAYVRAVFGQAMSQFHVVQRVDPFVRHPGTLERLLTSLQRIQHGMEVAVELERRAPHQHAWLLLNGSILLYTIARSLQTLGFEREVVAYFKWSLLCLESTVMLCTTKYILWRLQIYVAVCECLERLAAKRPKRSTAHLQAALACGEHAVRAVARLRKEEEMDVPLPKSVILTLCQAETIVNVLVARCRSIAKGEFFGRKVIENQAILTDPRDRVRVAMDALDKSALPSLGPDQAIGNELFDFVLEMVQPLFDVLFENTGDDVQTQRVSELDGLLPMPLHLNLIRHACRLEKSDGTASLVEAASVRARQMTNTDPLLLELDVWRALIDFHKPTSSDASEPDVVDRSAHRIRALAIAQSVRVFVTRVKEAIPITLRDLLISTALRVWKEGVVEILQQLDASPKPDDVDLEPHIVGQGALLAEAIYTILRAVYFDDMIVLGEICMRLSLFLHVQENRRKAIRTLRDFLMLLNAFRDRVGDGANQFSSLNAASRNALSRTSFSFEVRPVYAKSDCYNSHESSLSTVSRHNVGVEGTGSQLGSAHQELACIQVDATLLMFQNELEEAAMIDAIGHDAASGTSTRQSSMHVSTENALRKEYKKNPYVRVLLTIQLLRQLNEASNREGELVEECFKLLSQAEVQERDLNKHVIEPETAEPSASETTTPRPPRIVRRCSSSITIEVVPFKPSTSAARRRPIAYYMVFGKPSGAGTDVSLNNSEFPGTGEPLYSPGLRVTVKGLSPNESYVFAVAAFDTQGELIQAIGETTKPVVALNPLPLVACYGYLAQACYQRQLTGPARRAAMAVHDAVVSKQFGNRPSWAANMFYRHALKRDVIARWPIPLLDLAVQCVTVLCDVEDGDAARDGQVTSEGLVLRGRQTAALEASRMISIGLEIAAAVADYEQIRALCFKGYRLLLPLLHLDDTNALTFAALSTFYQALWCIPMPLWDTDTRSIAARIAFELMRIAWRHYHLVDAAYMQVARLKDVSTEAPYSSNPTTSTELAVLLDSIALAECANGRPINASSDDSRPTTAAMPSQPPGGKPAVATANAGTKAASAAAAASPPTTARVNEEVPLPRVSELIAQSKLSVREAFKLLEPLLTTSRDSLEVFCKLSQCAIDAGDEGAVEEWLPLLRVSGSLGSKCKEVLKSTGLGHALPEPVAAPPTVASSAPNTARSTSKTPRGQDPVALNAPNDGATMAPQSIVTLEPEIGEDDGFAYTWCGEVCLIEAMTLFRKLARYRSENDNADCSRGPRYDYAFSILQGAPTSEASDTTSNEQESTGSLEAEDQDPGLLLFSRFTSRMAASCRLFGLARAWQALQTAAQHAANAIWLAWISPETLGLPTNATTLNDVTICADSLLDMIEVVTAAVKDEQSGKTATIVDPGSDASKLATVTRNHMRSLASTTVVVSAMSSVNADQTWIANLLEFTIQALMAAKQWFKLVQIGKTYHLLSGGGTRFSERVFPILVYAQQQYLSEQTALLESAQTELAAFIKAFNDAEAKKKKKKSRLVVEEVLTPEEIEFRDKKAEMERHIQELAQEQSVRQRELDALKQMHDVVSRTANKCTQALDNCHGLVERYRRWGDAEVKQQQIVNAFAQCVALSRQKRQRRLAGKALQELGDFFWERGDRKSAAKAWNEAIDNAFNALRATTCWREIIGLDMEETSCTADALVEGDSLWTSLESCLAIAKVILFDSPTETPTLELARMAAATFTRIVTKCSLPHPSRSYLYGFHQIFSQIWPGRELLVDTERLDAPRVALMFAVTIQTLLQYEHAVEAMPLIAGYEHLSLQCFEDADHTANAQRLRLEALVQCGRFHEAFEVLALLLTTGVTNRDAKPTAPNALVAKLQFRDDKSIKDPSNSGVLTWLSSLDLHTVMGDLQARMCKPETARLVVAAVFKLVVGLAQREAIEEEAASSLRQIASKMAVTIVGMLTQTLDQLLLNSAQRLDEGSELAKSAPKAQPTVGWATLTLHHLHAEVLLQQGLVAASGGQWVAAQEFCSQSIQVALRTRIAVEDATKSSLDITCLSIDRYLPPALMYKPSTLVVRARLLGAKMGMAQGKHLLVIAQVRSAVDEARSHGEQAHFLRQLELLRAEAQLLVGSSDKALRELSALRDAFIAGHSCETSSYVELLRVTASVTRSQVMQSRDGPEILHRVLILLDEAEEMLDRILRRDGWTGTDVDTSEKRLSLFNPNVVVFVQLKAEVAQALMETPAEMSAATGGRMQRALLAIDVALKAVDHSITPLASTKAKLLLQKGTILKKMAFESQVARRDDAFDQCVASLVASIEEAIRVDVGGHDRELIRLALVELVDLYGAKSVSGKEAEHLQAAFHCLNLALIVSSHQQVLFDSLELQAGTLTNTEKLPAFVARAILDSAGASSAVAVEPARVPPPTAKGSAPQAVQDGSKRPSVDGPRVVNFFVKILREKNVLPACTDLQQTTAVLLHAFLVQNHSTYAKMCCLQSLPPIPRDDPEIKGGVISTHWMRDRTPAFTPTTDLPPSRPVTLFFILGTSRIEGHNELEESNEGVRARLERFATAPLLSKRVGIAETDIRHVGEQLSRLRIDMEDEDSLTIERAKFPTRFTSILWQIQRLLRRPLLSRPSEVTSSIGSPDTIELTHVSSHLEDPAPTSILDGFNTVVPVMCSLDAVKILESVFHVDMGVNSVVDNVLCYFLRDLLDT